MAIRPVLTSQAETQMYQVVEPAGQVDIHV